MHALSCVGVDFAGPLFVKSKVKDDPEMAKVYIALFTCATSRAVHLELVPSLDAPTFLLSWKIYWTPWSPNTNCFRQREDLSGLREDLS